MDKVLEERLKLAASLVVAEYNALRGEVQQAMDTAQGAVRWSTATFGVLLAAGLVASNSATQNSANQWAGVAALLIFGLALPGLVCSGAWTWLGELHRMERAGAHLRGIETRVGRIGGTGALLDGQPIWQERFIVAARSNKAAVGKQSLAYASTALLFGGAAGTSLTIFLGWHREMFHWGSSAWGLLAWTTMAGSLTIFATFLVVSVWLGVRLLALSGSISDLDRAESSSSATLTSEEPEAQKIDPQTRSGA